MQQNYINPETSALPDIAFIKRSLEFKNYLFNQQQLQRKSELIKKQKMQEMHRSAFEHEKALIQIENQKLQELQKKYQVQQTLKNAYNNQIHSRLRYKTQQKSYDRQYSQKQKELLQSQERSRIIDMSRIYKVGSSQKQRTNYIPNRKLLTQGCEDSLDNLKYQSFPQIKERNFISSLDLQQQNPNHIHQTQSMKPAKNTVSLIQQPSLQNSPPKKYSVLTLQYADYLKQQIQKRQKTKQQQKRKQLQKDKTWIENQNRAYSQKMEEINFLNQKKKQDYASGLQKQLIWKKQYFNKL